MKITLNRYPGGKRKALTLSYDDGSHQDYRLVEIMNRYGIRGTFHLNSGSLGQENRVKKQDVASLYQGHEVSCHTLDHPDLTLQPDCTILEEVLSDRRNLEQLTGYVVRGMSYPFGTHSPRVVSLLRRLGIEYSRTTAAHQTFIPPENFLLWHPTCHHRDGCLAKLEEFQQPRSWVLMPLFYLWGHSYEFDTNHNWDLIEEFCKRASGWEDVWYATNIEVCDYLRAVRSLHFSVEKNLVYNPAAVAVWIEVEGEGVKINPGLNHLQ